MRAKKPKKNPFSKEFAPYGRYSGDAGSPDQWAGAFKERMSPQQINEILGEENEWTILGLKPGATQAEIKSAFRKKARETHPDFNPQKADGAEFRKVRAAFEKLTID